MKACVVQKLSGPSGLVYTDVDDVTGGDDTVVIDVRAAGVCFPDLLLSNGEYQLKLRPPFIPGMEAAGVVRSAPEESEFKVGDRVSAFGVLGGYAELVVAPVANLTRKPRGTRRRWSGVAAGQLQHRVLRAGSPCRDAPG
jgi:NADPH:quinone reductase